MPADPIKNHVELVANSETRNPGVKKTRPGLHALSRSLCHSEACPVRDYSDPVVPRQGSFYIYVCSFITSSCFCPWTAFYNPWTAFMNHWTEPDFMLIGLVLVSFSFTFSVWFHVVHYTGCLSAFDCTLMYSITGSAVAKPMKKPKF